MVEQVAESEKPSGNELSDIQARLERAIEESDDERQRYHARKAAQHVVIARESE